MKNYGMINGSNTSQYINKIKLIQHEMNKAEVN